jgi:hypothetical protein
MKSKICALILAGYLASGATAARLVVTGSTLDCLAGKTYHTAGVDVFIFAESPALRTLIENVLKSNDDNVFDRFNRLIKFMRGGAALAHTKSDRNGSFKAEIPASEKLIVLGYMETEDNPLYWMHTDVNVNRQAMVSVILDYCKPR